jgi:hypothetical protein
VFVRRLRLLPLLLAAPALLVACSDDKADREDGAIAKAGKISVFDVAVGDCLNPGDELDAEITDIEAVPCADPHTHEVFAMPEYEEDDLYPGEEALRNFADASCMDSFSTYTGSEYLESNLYFSYLQPSIRSWNEGDDRRVVCVIVATGDPLTGSARRVPTANESDDGGEDGRSKEQRQIESAVEGQIEGRLREAVGADR